MRILVCSRFHPSIGGIETVAELLAREWAKQSIAVTIVTDVAAAPRKDRLFSFAVYHRPSPRSFLNLLRTHDIFVHFNISLRAIWPLLFIPRPFVAVHHGFYIVDRTGRRNWRERLKLHIAKSAVANIAASRAIAENIGIKCKIIPNPYDAAVFFQNHDIKRDKELIFVGRLVSDKGADVLLQALAFLKKKNVTPDLTIVGDGPERAYLDRLVDSLGLTTQVSFTGAKRLPEIAELMRSHKTLVVPSLWNEPFGVVALEGAASGCVVLGSDGGGLPEAIGPCGLIFPNGDAGALATAIERVLADSDLRDKFRSNAAEHLARHEPTRVARRYLDVISQVLLK